MSLDYFNHDITCGGIRFRLEVGYRWVPEYRPSADDPGLAAHAEFTSVDILWVDTFDGAKWTRFAEVKFQDLNSKQSDGWAEWFIESMEDLFHADIDEDRRGEWQERAKRHREAMELV